MRDPRDWIIGMLAGFFMGLGFAAWAQGKLDARAVASGYVVHGETAYRLVPTPNPIRSE